MKRIFTFSAIAAAAILLVSCAKENFTDNIPTQGTKLSLDLPAEKTFLGNNVGGKRALYWSNGDTICVNGKVSNPLVIAEGDSLKSAQFTFKEVLSTPYYIAYPASVWTDNSSVTLPAVVEYIPLLGYQSSEGTVTMKYATSVMRFTVKKGTSGPCRLAYLEVSAAGVQMNGVFSADFENGVITAAETVSAENNHVRKNINAELGDNPVDVFIPVPAGTYAAKVKLIDAKGNFMEKEISSREFKKGQIHALTEFAFEPTGTVVDVNIASAAQWNAFADNFNTGMYADVNPLVVSIDSDLDFTGLTPVSAGSYVGDKYCSAVIIGNNHAISNYSSGEPLVGCVNTYGSVSDLTFDETCSFAPDLSTGVKSYFGTFTDYLKGELKNCVNKADITINLPASGTTSTDKYCGGIAARIREGKMTACKNYGTITSAAAKITSEALYIGGLAGRISNADGIINACENHGAIIHNATANTLVAGGISGLCTGTVKNCTNDAAITVNTTRETGDPCKFIIVGGITGESSGVILDSCVNAGTITSESNVKNQTLGGIIGKVAAASTIGVANINSGDIIANKEGRTYYFGGIIGLISAEGTYTFAGTPNTGKIKIIGMEAISSSYLYAGGLVGRNAVPVTIQGQDLETNCDITLDNSVAKTTAISAVGGVLGGTHVEGAKPTILDCKVTGNGIQITGAKVYTTGDAGFGGILGNSGVGAVIRRCTADIPVTSENDAQANGTILELGGVAGRINGADSEISDCVVGAKTIRNGHYNNNAISKSTGNVAGGIIGSFGHKADNTFSITISNCSTAATLYTRRCAAGGVAGFLNNATVTGCTCTGKIEFANYAGGLVGYASKSSFTGCTFNNENGILSSSGGSCKNYAGGLAGQTVESSFTNCSTYFGTSNGVKASGGATAGAAPGSLIGYSDASSTITTCKAGGKLQAANLGMPGDESIKSATLDATTVVSYAIGNLGMDPAPTSDDVTLWNGQ